MREIIEGTFAIIVLLLLFQALFPQVLAEIVTTAKLAIFVGITAVIIGGAVWLFFNRE